MLKSRIILPLTAAVVLLGSVTAAHAQGGPGGAPGGGGMQMTPEQQARMKQFMKFRESHKNVFQLQTTMRNLADMDKDPKTAVSKDQAKKLLAIMNAWSSKPVMTDAQAQGVNKQVTATMSTAQIKKMAQMAAERGRGGMMGGGGRMGGPGGGGAPGGGGGRMGGGAPGGGGGGGRMGGGGGRGGSFTLKDYNPLNAASMPEGRMRDGAKKRLADMKAALTKRAAG
jgi:hypothetical protein